MISKIKNLFHKDNKSSFWKEPLVLTFGNKEWRMEFDPKYINGKKVSNIRLYAANILMFEGSYLELIERVKGKK